MFLLPINLLLIMVDVMHLQQFISSHPVIIFRVLFSFKYLNLLNTTFNKISDMIMYGKSLVVT